jgi:hypothetical protein
LRSVDELGSAVLGPGDTARIGNVDLEYHRSLDFGTTEIIAREPGVTATIDRSVEPIDGAWGARSIVPTEQPSTFGVGDYRVELHPQISSGSPSRLEVRVLRRTCLPSESADWPEGDFASVWLGNTAMVVHSLNSDEGRIDVQLHENGAGETLRLQWAWNSLRGNYRDGIDVTPASVGRQFSGLGVRARIAQVEAGPGVVFDDGHWSSADGTPQVAVRVDIQRQAPGKAGPRQGLDGAGCGEPSLTELPLPTSAAQKPRRAGRAKVGLRSPVTLEGLSLSLSHEPGETAPSGRPSQMESWMLSAKDPSGQVLDNAWLFVGQPARLRVDDALLLIEPVKPPGFDPVRVRRFALACPQRWVGPMAAEPQVFWLGTLGITQVMFERAPLDYQLTAQLRAYGHDIHLLVGHSGDMSYSTAGLSPDDVGRRFWIGEREVELAAVEAGSGTHWDGNGWATTDGAGPNVLVYLRLHPKV